jgi:hypothetical protein
MTRETRTKKIDCKESSGIHRQQDEKKAGTEA